MHDGKDRLGCVNCTSQGIHKSLTARPLLCQKLMLHSRCISADKLVRPILMSKLSNWPFEAETHYKRLTGRLGMISLSPYDYTGSMTKHQRHFFVLHLVTMAALFNKLPSQCLWETFSHTAGTAWKLTCTQLSTTVYSQVLTACVLEQCRLN